MDRLAGAGEYRDDETGLHTHRVGAISASLARALGANAGVVALIGRAAPLHDVGKIGIPDRVLLKPGPLTADEAAIMRTHTTIGAELLSGGEWELTRMAEQIALSHHERCDGTGYPHGLAGEAIPWAARIVSIAGYHLPGELRPGVHRSAGTSAATYQASGRQPPAELNSTRREDP